MAGAVTGIGVAAMRYLGMAAIHTTADLRYASATVALSIVIAVAAATSALWAATSIRALWSSLGRVWSSGGRDRHARRLGTHHPRHREPHLLARHPRKVPEAGHTVHVGWFTEQHPDKPTLLPYMVDRWDLLVIPERREVTRRLDSA